MEPVSIPPSSGGKDHRLHGHGLTPERPRPPPKDNLLTTFHPITKKLEDEPLDLEQVQFGNPRTSVLTLVETKEGSESGLWRCTPGTVTDTEVHESFLVITGRGTMEFEDGRSIELEPGVTVTFEGGEKTTWIVKETILKAFWIAA